MDFAKEGVGDDNDAVGSTRLHIDDAVVAEGTMRTQVGLFTSVRGRPVRRARISSDAARSATLCAGST